MDSFEYLTSQDLLYDFCLWEYEAIAPRANKLSSANLLFHSFEIAGLDGRMREFIQTIRAGIGFSRTVWGIKCVGKTIRWEFYFYDYRRRERERSITRLLDIMRPFVRCNIRINEQYHYFMFSIDIDSELVSGAKDLDTIHMYIGNPGSAVSSGICYLLTPGGSRLENIYFFFDARNVQDIMAKAACSAHIDTTQVHLDEILWPEMRDCGVIVVANKRANDGIYFSRINVDQLIYFVRRMEYPETLIAFIEENRSRLDHLLYDVGYDYTMEGGNVKMLKSGYYGIF